MPVAVHDHRVVGQASQTSHKPTAIDQSRTDALGQCRRRFGILDYMVVKRNDPASARVLFGSNAGRHGICNWQTRFAGISSRLP
jgi:hypothetical protein